MLIRLSTGVPIDMPFWFDVDDDVVHGYGRTLVRTFRIGNHYKYPIDNGKQFGGLQKLPKGINTLINLFLTQTTQNRIIRAIEFSSVGFQMFHAPTRLVNQVTFLETLFNSKSSKSTEITFQLSSSISWYLRAQKTPEEREQLFELVKDIYNARSRVVHGDDNNNPTYGIRKSLIIAEDLNTEIFNAILEKNHINLFSMGEKRRKKQLQKLSIGIPCDFLN